jgi:hypothetical protein
MTHAFEQAIRFGSTKPSSGYSLSERRPFRGLK